MEIQPGEGLNAIVILETPDEALIYGAGLNLIARAVLLYRARAGNFPVALSPTNSDLANVASRLYKKAQKQREQGWPLQALPFEITAEQIYNFLDNNSAA